jgi:hypothetical protein
VRTDGNADPTVYVDSVTDVADLAFIRPLWTYRCGRVRPHGVTAIAMLPLVVPLK